MKKEYKVGDVVRHKVMPGKFVIVRHYGGWSNASRGIDLRGEDGGIINVDKEELK